MMSRKVAVVPFNISTLKLSFYFPIRFRIKQPRGMTSFITWKSPDYFFSDTRRPHLAIVFLHNEPKYLFGPNCVNKYSFGRRQGTTTASF